MRIPLVVKGQLQTYKKKKQNQIGGMDALQNLKVEPLNLSEMFTSGFPVESIRTNDDFPTFGAPTRQSVGFSKSTTGIARNVWRNKNN